MCFVVVLIMFFYCGFICNSDSCRLTGDSGDREGGRYAAKSRQLELNPGRGGTRTPRECGFVFINTVVNLHHILIDQMCFL